MNSNSHSLPQGVMRYSVTALVAAVIFCSPVQAQNMCDSQASLVNPAAALSPGFGGTGAPRTDVITGQTGGIGGTGISNGGMGGTGAPRDEAVAGRPGVGGSGISSGGMGGTGAPRDEAVAGRPGIGGSGISSGGMGGTGARRDEAVAGGRPGIGGTGIRNGVTGGMGGTGIVGVITGFASICVNGLEVQYDASTPVFADGRGATAGELAVGQVVAVRAAGAGAQLSASNIAVIHVVVGPVSRADAATGQLELLGQSVRVNNPGDLSNLKPGDWVQVSGYRLASGEVAASRVEPTAARARAQISGQIGEVDVGGFTLHGTRVGLGNLSLPGGAVTGSEVVVRGSWTGTRLLAQAIELEPTRQSVGRVDNVVLEGYVHALSGSELSLGSNLMTLAPNVQISGPSGSPLAIDQRVQVRGRVGADQRITVDRVDVRGGGSGSGADGASSGRSSTSSSGKGSSSDSSDGSRGKGSSGGDDGSGSKSGSGSGSGSSGSGSSGSSGKGSSGSGSSGSSGSGSGSGSSGSSGSGSGSGSSGSSGSGSGSGSSGSSGSGSSSGSSGSSGSGSGSGSSGSSGSGSSGGGSSGSGGSSGGSGSGGGGGGKR
ncbi:DUF5666 domain-containing protein [Polaromonas sp.]|uniref:DUF5666 domain-containing protein n=1 Tax=Polaromonas sp. TaxID=1869339 RepID=UPI00183F0CEA|nr:DUF5666 domain-containing protein [Polaromonas sp.]NMM07228.1 hypothetical protein [Polaromonas sp.]